MYPVLPPGTLLGDGRPIGVQPPNESGTVSLVTGTSSVFL